VRVLLDDVLAYIQLRGEDGQLRRPKRLAANRTHDTDLKRAALYTGVST